MNSESEEATQSGSPRSLATTDSHQCRTQMFRELVHLVVGKSTIWTPENKPQQWDEVVDQQLTGKSKKDVEKCKKWNNPTAKNKDSVETVKNKLKCIIYILRQQAAAQNKAVPSEVEEMIHLFEDDKMPELIFLRRYKVLNETIRAVEQSVLELKQTAASINLGSERKEALAAETFERLKRICFPMRSSEATQTDLSFTDPTVQSCTLANSDSGLRGEGNASGVSNDCPPTPQLAFAGPTQTGPITPLTTWSPDSASSQKSVKRQHEEHLTSISQSAKKLRSSPTPLPPDKMTMVLADIEDTRLDGTTESEAPHRPLQDLEDIDDVLSLCELLDNYSQPAPSAQPPEPRIETTVDTFCESPGQEEEDHADSSSKFQHQRERKDSYESGYSSGQPSSSEQSSPLSLTQDHDGLIEEQNSKSNFNLIAAHLQEAGEDKNFAESCTESGLELADPDLDLLNFDLGSPSFVNEISDFNFDGSDGLLESLDRTELPEVLDSVSGNLAATPGSHCDPVLADYGQHASDADKEETLAANFTFPVP